MLHSSFIWQLMTLRTGLVAVVVMAATNLYSAIIRFFGTDTTTGDSVVKASVISLISAVLVVALGKALELWIARRQAKTQLESKHLTDSQESQVRYADLQLRDGIDLRERNDNLNIVVIRILESQIEGLQASAVTDHQNLVAKDKEIDELVDQIEELKRDRGDTRLK